MNSQESELAIDLSQDFYRTSLRAFLETAGFSAALPILRPISEGFGRLSAQGQIAGIKPSTLNEIVSYQCTMKEVLFGAKARGEMYEKGAKVYVSSCRLQGQFPEICFLCCSTMSEACTKVLNPDCDQFLVRSLSSGDTECEWTVRRRGDLSANLGDRVQFEPLIPHENEIKAVRSCLPKIYVQSWILITEAFLETMSEDIALIALQRYIRSLGMEKCEEYSRVLRIENLDIDCISHLAKRVFGLLHIEKVDASARKLSGDRDLHFPFSMSSLAICLQIEAFCSGLLEAINPDYEPEYDEMISSRHAWCPP